MIKGLAITPPVIGRICIGKLVQKQDKWVPEKDDSFTLTTQIQQKGGWLLPAFFKIVVAQSCFKQPLSAPARVSRAAPDLASRHR